MSIPVQLVWALSLGQLGAVMSRVDHPRSVGTVGGTAMLIRREAFDRVGGFDEDFFMYCEEADVAKRLERASLERHFVPTVEVLHHRLQSTVTMPERRINEVWRSLELYLAKHHGRLEARIRRARSVPAGAPAAAEERVVGLACAPPPRSQRLQR
jgi:GT2 family glycosyltransferase